MKRPVHTFLGVKTSDWNTAKSLCESLIGHQLRCTDSMFYGGKHCHTTTDDASYELRLNHHDDGWGWSWCVNDPQYPLVLSGTLATPAAYQRIFGTLHKFELIELPSGG